MALAAGIATGTAVAVLQNKELILDKLADVLEQAAQMCRQHLQENQMYAADIPDGEYLEKNYGDFVEKTYGKSSGVFKGEGDSQFRGESSSNSSGASTPNATDDEDGFSDYSAISSIADLDDFAYSEDPSEEILPMAELD